jgi:uncharacterized protein YuzE
MSTEHYRFILKSTAPPTVEVDSRSSSVYVRFKKATVARTVAQKCPSMHVAIDLDSKGEIIGFEAVGIKQFSLGMLFKKASVDAPGMDFSRARYVPTELVEA